MPPPAAGMAMKSPLGQRIERLLPTGQHPGRRWAGGLALVILSGIAVLSFSLRTLPPDPAPVWPSDRASAVTREVTPETLTADETALRLTANPFPAEGS